MNRFSRFVVAFIVVPVMIMHTVSELVLFLMKHTVYELFVPFLTICAVYELVAPIISMHTLVDKEQI